MSEMWDTDRQHNEIDRNVIMEIKMESRQKKMKIGKY